jgi:DNA-binding Lrp family transcriptional regulator
MIKKLKEQGIIKEFTVVPDFSKLGYGLMVFNFIKLKEKLKSTELDEFREPNFAKKHPHAEIINAKGIGLAKDAVFVTFFKDYSSYTEFKHLTKNVCSQVAEAETFLVNLKDKSLTGVLSMSSLAQDVLTLEEEKL